MNLVLTGSTVKCHSTALESELTGFIGWLVLLVDLVVGCWLVD